MYNMHNDAILWQIHDFLFDGSNNVCYISHHLRNICKYNKMSNFDLENEGQGQGG